MLLIEEITKINTDTHLFFIPRMSIDNISASNTTSETPANDNHYETKSNACDL